MQVSKSESDPKRRQRREHQAKTDAFLGMIRQGSGGLWETNAKVNGVPIAFQINTGAEVTVISENNYDRFREDTILLPTRRILCGPNEKLLSVRGQLKAKIRIGKNTSSAFVKAMLESLREKPEFFPDLFTRLGNLEEYMIRLSEGARPFALSTPRRLPVLLMHAVKEELATTRSDRTSRSPNTVVCMDGRGP